jgi:cell growth-regulating nucleolar protein
LAAVEGFRGSSRAKQLLEKLTNYPNIPRKKAKFINFMKNSFRSFGVTDAILEEIWSEIEKFDKKSAETQPASNGSNGVKRKLDQTENENGNEDTQNKNNNKKLNKNGSNEIEKENSTSNGTHNDENGADNSFDWFESIKSECSKKENNQIKLKKLQKKVCFF